MVHPDNDMMMSWLDDMNEAHFICGDCDGVHLSRIQEIATVLESRLFVEDYGILLTSEAAIRPSLMISLVGEMSNINAGFPFLKVFVDVVDQELPRLVIANTLLIGKTGVTQEQFEQFIETTLLASEELFSEARPYIWDEDISLEQDLPDNHPPHALALLDARCYLIIWAALRRSVGYRSWGVGRSTGNAVFAVLCQSDPTLVQLVNLQISLIEPCILR